MNKETIKRFARKLGFNICSIDRIGVDVEVDLARLTENDPLRIIFDVGGNFGQTALRFASAFPAATIFSFEPVPRSFETLKNVIKNNQSIKPFNLALGDESGTVQINITSNSGSNTIVKKSEFVNSVFVPIERLDVFASTHSIEAIDLLKIDVEGYEIPVLTGAESLLERGKIRYIFAEVVLAEDTKSPHTSFFDLHSRLEKYGFCFLTYYSESFRLQDGCAMGNALYALRPKLPQKVSGRTFNIF